MHCVVNLPYRASEFRVAVRTSIIFKLFSLAAAVFLGAMSF